MYFRTPDVLESIYHCKICKQIFFMTYAESGTCRKFGARKNSPRSTRVPSSVFRTRECGVPARLYRAASERPLESLYRPNHTLWIAQRTGPRPAPAFSHWPLTFLLCISVYSLNIPTVMSAPKYLDGQEVATHNSRESCWIIVHGTLILFNTIIASET